MSTATYTGIVHGNSVSLDEPPTDLADGTRVLVTPLPQPGSMGALLAAIHTPPHLTREDVAELEVNLEAGNRQASAAPTF